MSRKTIEKNRLKIRKIKLRNKCVSWKRGFAKFGMPTDLCFIPRQQAREIRISQILLPRQCKVFAKTFASLAQDYSRNLYHVTIKFLQKILPHQHKIPIGTFATSGNPRNNIFVETSATSAQGFSRNFCHDSNP